MSKCRELCQTLVSAFKSNALPSRDLFLVYDQARYNKSAQKSIKDMTEAEFPVMLRNQAE